MTNLIMYAMIYNGCCTTYVLIKMRGVIMPPKPKFTKDEIIEAAFQIVRERGAEALTARELGEKLSTSSRPIFTAFDGMNELKLAVLERCREMYAQFVKNEKNSGKYPEYKSMGMAYIRLAKEEKNVFKLLYMRDTTNEHFSADDSFSDATKTVMRSLNIDSYTAERLHFEIWAWVHGVASMLATSYLSLDYDVISEMLTDVYTSLKERVLHV